MPKFTPIRNQQSWGHPAPYPDGVYRPAFRPKQWVLHYGGGRAYGVTDWDSCARRLLSVRRYHTGTQGWSDIAYNWSGDPDSGKPVRLRGENRNGAHRGSIYWGPITRTFFFTVGGDEVPLLGQRLAFARMWVEDPLPVTGHGLLPDVTINNKVVSQDTACPGPWLRSYIRRQGWIEDLGVHVYGEKDLTVRYLRKRLKALGYGKWSVLRRRFTRSLERKVKRFQRDHDLVQDGVVGPQTWRALGGAA